MTTDDRSRAAHARATECWESNADTWTALVRAGYDVYRDYLNTPGFFAMLPDVRGLCGFDIGCGEGHNTRLLAGRGARMTAVDVSPTFIRHARGGMARRSATVSPTRSAFRSPAPHSISRVRS